MVPKPDDETTPDVAESKPLKPPPRDGTSRIDWASLLKREFHTPETMALGEVPPGELLLSDLQTLPSRDIFIVLSPTGECRLRFDNRIWNSGHGPVEAFPVSGDCDGDGNTRNDRLAIQRIFRDTNKTGVFERGKGQDTGTVSDEHKIGCMQFHARHNHWHIEDFATYELYPLPSSLTRDDRVGVSTKVSFCMIDTFAHGLTLPGAPSGPFYRNWSQGGAGRRERNRRRACRSRQRSDGRRGRYELHRLPRLAGSWHGLD